MAWSAHGLERSWLGWNSSPGRGGSDNQAGWQGQPWLPYDGPLQQNVAHESWAAAGWQDATAEWDSGFTFTQGQRAQTAHNMRQWSNYDRSGTASSESKQAEIWRQNDWESPQTWPASSIREGQSFKEGNNSCDLDSAPMMEYLKTFPRDSYTPVKAPDLQYTSEDANGADMYVATLILPSARGPCTIRSHAHASHRHARKDVLAQANAKIDEWEKSKDEVLTPISESSMQPLPRSTRFGIVHNLDLADEKAVWRSSDVVIFTITLFDCNGQQESTDHGSFGFVVAKSSNAFSEYCWDYPLTGGRVVRIRIPEKPVEVPGDIFAAAPMLRDFHRAILKDHLFNDEDEDLPVISSVFSLLARLEPAMSADGAPQLVLTKAADGTSGEELQEVPIWLGPVMQKWQNLYDLVIAFQIHSPLQPMPNPSNLLTIFNIFMEAPSVHNVSTLKDAKFEALRVKGSKCLNLYLAVMIYDQYPLEHASQLQKRLAQLLEDRRLASLLTRSNVLMAVPNIEGHGWKGLEQQHAALAHILLALLGAFFEEGGGGFHSIAELWTWMNENSDGKHSPQVANWLFGQTKPNKVRTMSHHRFWEEKVEGEPILQVMFSEGPELCIEMQFRRAKAGVRPFPQERCVKVAQTEKPESEWTNIMYDSYSNSFVSTVLEEHGSTKKALPNKMGAWLSRAPIRSLLKNPHKIKNSSVSQLFPPYTEIQEGLEDTLIVHYTNKGKIEYRIPPDGSLGVEKRGESIRPIIWSESEKVLLSPHLEAPLNDKIVGWGFGLQCLAALVSAKAPKNERRNDNVKYAGYNKVDSDDVEVSEQNDDIIKWTSTPKWRGEAKTCFSCRAELTTRGYIYLVTDDKLNDEWEPVSWVHAAETWRSAMGILPSVVLAWLDQHAQCMGTPQHIAARCYHQVTPPPLLLRGYTVTSCFKGVDLNQANSSLNHVFDSPMLILPAFYHSSNVDGFVPSNDRLAFIGAVFLEELVTTALLDEIFPPPLGLAHSGHVQQTKVGSMSLEIKPPKCTEEPLLDRLANFDREVTSCCNHLACAVRCVRLHLQKCCQFSPTDVDLKNSVTHFEGVLRRADKDEDMWPRLVANDAPRVLGDTFLAAIGAVLIDSTVAKATEDLRDLIDDHVQECRHAFIQAEVLPKRCSAETIDREQFAEVIRDGKKRQVWGNFAGQPALSSTDLEGESPSQHQQAISQIKATLGLIDYHVFEISLEGEQQLVGGTSPRVAEMRCAYLANNRLPTMGDSELLSDRYDSEDDSTGASEEADDHHSGQAVYCETCEMWLNGPTQWEDHKKGKKHGKNIKKSKNR